MSDTNVYTKWLIKLNGRLRNLQAKISYTDVPSLEREVNTCEAEVKHLYDYAFQHKVDLRHYYQIFVEIDSLLRNIKYQIEEKRRPWWQKALNVVIRVINVVTSILGWGPILSTLQLPSNRIRGELPPWEDDDDDY